MAEHFDHTTEVHRFTDEQLVHAYSLNGNGQLVFLEIVRRYKEKVYYHIRRIVISHEDADDAMQNTFIKVWENLGNFRGDCALYSWIYRIATNEALSIIRKRKPEVSEEQRDHFLSGIADTSPTLTGDEISRRLQAATMKLPEKQRLVFYLKYFEDLSYDRISEITGTSVGALKASYFHAVNKIESVLKRNI